MGREEVSFVHANNKQGRTKMSSDERITLREATDRMTSGTVLLNVVFHQPGMSRPGDMAEVTTSADKTMLALRKHIVRSQAYIDMNRASMYCHGSLRGMSVPSNILRRGCHKVPVARLEDVIETVRNYEADYMAAGQEFVAAWPQLVEQAKERLNDQFRDSDYPTQEYIQKAIWVEYYLTEQNTPAESKLGADLFKEEQFKARSRARDEVETCIQAMRESLKAVLEKFISALGTRSDGRKAALRDKSYEAAVEFLTMFKDRNVLGDSRAQELANLALQVIDSAEPETLRTDDAFREEVRGMTEKVVVALDRVIEDGPSRMFCFDE